MGVNSLPKTVTRQRRSCDLNPGPTEHESSTLTTRLPSQPQQGDPDPHIKHDSLHQPKSKLQRFIRLNTESRQTDGRTHARTHTHTHPFNGPLSGTTRVSRYQKGKTNLDFTGARNSEWQWHQLGMCKSAPRTRQTTTPAPHHSVFLQAGCLSCHPTNSVKALNAKCGLITAKEINTLST